MTGRLRGWKLCVGLQFFWTDIELRSYFYFVLLFVSGVLSISIITCKHENLVMLPASSQAVRHVGDILWAGDAGAFVFG